VFPENENGILHVTPHGCYKNRCFRGTYHLHHQSDTNQQARSNVSTNWQPKHAVKKYSNVLYCTVL
jgi:hypothetical protein